MVKYTRGYTPLCLVDKALEAHNKNCKNKKYEDSSSRYKCKFTKDSIDYYPIRDALRDIYRNKCAYCETHFNRSYIKIEHYRPKSIYYALAYSWSNLLPICDICNTTKSNNFEVDGISVVDDIRSLEKLQYVTEEFNRIEKPKFLHPEIDEYRNMFRFDLKGKIIVKDTTDNHRMTYTIDNADLNEKALMLRRAKVLKDFTNITNELFYLSQHKVPFSDSMNQKITDFFNDENEFIAVRQFIIEYLRVFLSKYKNSFAKEFTDALKRYIKDIEVYNN